MSHYDLIVIGSGPAGRSAAIQAGKLRRKVLVVERGRKVGGVSVHTGTIPSKTLRETIMNLSGFRERSFYGRAYRAKEGIDAQDLKMRLLKTSARPTPPTAMSSAPARARSGPNIYRSIARPSWTATNCWSSKRSRAA